MTPERLAEIKGMVAVDAEPFDSVSAWDAINDLLAHIDTLAGEWRPTHDFCVSCQGMIKPTWVCESCGSVGAKLEDVEPEIKAALEPAPPKPELTP